MLGRTIGKYRVVEKIGRGGMGTVYKAIDETLDREVAIKALNRDLGENEVVRRFRAEAMTLARLNHPGIATIYELLRVEEGSLYPALHRMEQEGWLRSYWGMTDKNREARFYELTARGRQQLEAERESWARLTDGVGRVLRYA